MHNFGSYVTTATVAAGVLGGAYYAYCIYKEEQKTKLPSQWRLVGTLKSIDIFPIKSCGPVKVDQVECTILGPKNGWLRDRVLMVVDEKNRFITARGYPELVLVQPSIVGSTLTLNYGEMEPLKVDLAEIISTQTPKPAVVWGVTVPILDCGQEASNWFSRILNRSTEFRLVYYASSSPRKLKMTHKFFKFTKNDTGALGDEISFSLMNESSVLDLNTRLENCQVSPKLFRANFLLQGAQPYDEDGWNFIKIGNNVFEIIKPCLRCLMTAIDPETGIPYDKNEPLEALKCYRQLEDPVVRRAEGAAPRMGTQMALRSAPGGRISINDDVYVA